MANRIHWYGATFAALATFTYVKLVYYVPDGHVGLLYNKTSNKIENYVMHPGPHIRSSLYEECLLFKNNDNLLYATKVENVATADKRSKKEMDEGRPSVEASLKILYRISVKDVANLYRDYGSDDVYPKEVFGDAATKCVSKVTAAYKFADLAKGIQNDEKFLRPELTKCIAEETARRLVVVNWAQITSISNNNKSNNDVSSASRSS